jgi:RNA polymerase sigma-70 factor (ECF subfamily)
MSSATTIDELLPPVLPAAYRAAYALTRNAADASDVVQEAALNACRAFHTFEPGTNFRAWFLRIVTNVFLLQCRKDRRSGHPLSLEAVNEQDGGESRPWLQTGDGYDPLGNTITRVDTAAILAALEKLPLEYRSVAVLYFIEDMPYEEIARICDCPIGTVRSRLHRARRLLRAELMGLALERGYGGESFPGATGAAARSARRPTATHVA